VASLHLRPFSVSASGRLLGLSSVAGHHDLEEERETASRVLKISNQLGREGLNGG
jgi:hypothetical protein